jgi:Cu-Zn family superoxide dismutase
VAGRIGEPARRTAAGGWQIRTTGGDHGGSFPRFGSGCHRPPLHANQRRIEDEQRHIMKHPIGTSLCLALLTMVVALPASAADLTVTLYQATRDGTGATIGSVTISGSEAGATFKLALHGLPPGPHGFLVHENADCGPTFINGIRIPAGAAGAPLDPDNTGKHAGPTGDGYLGDLPVLTVAADGTTTQTLTAPRIKNIEVLKGHALVIHIGGDNYSDSPDLVGGTGGRLACGAIG